MKMYFFFTQSTKVYLTTVNIILSFLFSSSFHHIFQLLICEIVEKKLIFHFSIEKQKNDNNNNELYVIDKLLLNRTYK